MKNAILWEIKRFYKDEFEIGIKALDMIEKETRTRLPDEEAGFIAFHLVNAQLNEEQPMVQGITKLIQQILTIVRIHFGIEFKEESVFYYRFITHLKFFLQRLFQHNIYAGNADDELLEVIKSKYGGEFKCILKIKTFIHKKYNYDLTSDEIIYLTIHVAKIMQDNVKVDIMRTVEGLTSWGSIDLVSAGSGEMEKRYGFIYYLIRQIYGKFMYYCV